MGQVLLQVTRLADTPTEAAARFYAEEVPRAQELLGGNETLDALAIVFPDGGKAHLAWQLAAVQSLARELAPVRVNGLAGGAPDAIDEAVEWLAHAPGVTGQVLTL